MDPWILAIRPKTLPAGLAPVILGLAYGYWSCKHFDIVVAVATVATGLLLQVIANLNNDYFDFFSGVDNGERLGPVRVTASGLLAVAKVKRGIVLAHLMALLLGSYLVVVGGWTIFFIGILSLLFAYLYSAGPIPLSHYALGEFLAWLFFGVVAVGGT
ncbi:MAG: 1,4-dihydroxy-2-naphthoate octaprenyltransferase, partial [Oligoflexia bacterium]|nr:1,4-dihydroxy-2-naphthoate octaprenyltransferase [Oligoflexia bacterium]